MKYSYCDPHFVIELYFIFQVSNVDNKSSCTTYASELFSDFDPYGRYGELNEDFCLSSMACNLTYSDGKYLFL